MGRYYLGMDIFLSVCLGLGLAAACGFRVFVPFLVMSVAANSGYLTLAESFGWVASVPALVTFAVATTLEIAAYYVPWVDNLLDTVSSPAAVVAGVVVSASVITGLDPYLKWTLAVIAGGGLAGSVQLLTIGARSASTLATAGFGNPVVSTMEVGSSIVLSLVAAVAPLVAMALLVVFFVFAWSRLGRWRRQAAPQES